MNQNTYSQLLTTFYGETKTLYDGSYFPAPFIPHVMSNYWYSKRRIFYVGRDTNDWLSLSDFLESGKQNNFDGYVELSSNWLNDFGFLGYNNNKAYGFWTFVARMHLALKGFKEDHKINISLPQKLKNLLTDVGWGNLNTIETQPSLEKNEYWKSINHENYWKIKKTSREIDQLKHLIDVFAPDFIIITNWCSEEDKNNALSGLEFTSQKIDALDGKLMRYDLTGSKTKIIWTVHPRNLPYKSLTISDMINAIEKIVNA